MVSLELPECSLRARTKNAATVTFRSVEFA